MDIETGVSLEPIVVGIDGGLDTMKRFQVGDTARFTWVSSGVTIEANSSHVTIYTGSETVIATYDLVSSGSGLYYANVAVPDTPGFYVGEFVTLVGSGHGAGPGPGPGGATYATYRRRQKFWAVTNQVD